jgi:MYXO-CTERM domain-containing protein
MTRRIGQFAAAGLLAAASSVAVGDFFAPGADNGWDIGGATSAMTETFLGSGIWNYAANPGTPGTRTTWNVVATAGDWGSQLYTSDQWGFYDGGGNVTLTLDTNTYNDGWLPTTNRITTSTAGSLAWVVTGNWVAAAGVGGDWDLGTAPSLVSGGGGILEYTVTGLPAGSYAWKAVANPSDGNWDTITEDVSTTVAGSDNLFSVSGPADVIIMQIDTSNGTARSIPTPGALALVGVGGLAATRRRRR